MRAGSLRSYPLTITISKCSDRPKKGTVRDDGFILVSHNQNGKPCWSSPESYNSAKIANVVYATRKRANAHNVPHSIDAAYLASIFPDDFRCPVLGIEMQWGDLTGRDSSPSLDRLRPADGYVPGNVAWMSLRANRFKNNASLEEIESIAAYMRNQTKHGTT